jgi:NADH-quinone oxidoreductase subunit C
MSDQPDQPVPPSTPPAPVPPAVKPAAPPPAPDPKVLALRDEAQALLGEAARFELNGKLPAFRLAPADMKGACRRMKDAGFDYLLFVTAVDYPAEKRIEMVYLLTNFRDGRSIALLADLDRNRPSIESVSDVWDAADWHEREVFDMFGVQFSGHPDLRRILLDDTWDGFPLRKDYVDKTHDVVKRPY